MATTTTATTDNNSPATKHPSYDDLKSDRDLVRAVVDGVSALSKDNATYLPQYDGETDASYTIRKSTATINPYTRKAVNVLAGMVFAGEIEFVNVPGDIKAILEDVNKEGDHINVYAREWFEEAVLIDGYGVTVVDTPQVFVESQADVRRSDTKPFARRYNADSILNWRYGVDATGRKALEMLTLVENVPVADGRFGQTNEVRYIVFEKIAGVVSVEIFIESDAGGSSEPVSQGAVTLTTADIPVVVAGELGDEPPLYDIARKNLEHYQTYSLMKSDAHKTCVPQRVIEGGSADSIAPISGDVTLFPPAGMKAYFIEVAGTSLEFVRQLCKDIAADIAAMTSSIVAGTSDGPDVTATGEIIANTQETADLRPMAESFKDALERLLALFAELMGKGTGAGGEVILPTQWSIAQAAVDSQPVMDAGDAGDANQEVNAAAANA